MPVSVGDISRVPGRLYIRIAEDEIVPLQSAVQHGEPHRLPGDKDDRRGIEAMIPHDDRHITWRFRGPRPVDRDLGWRLPGTLHAQEHERRGDDGEQGEGSCAIGLRLLWQDA